MYKKLITGLVALAMAATTLGLSWSAVFAKSVNPLGMTPTKTMDLAAGKPEILTIGRAGIYMPKSGYNGVLNLWRYSIGTTVIDHSPTVRFIDPLLQWSVEGSNNKADVFLHGRNFVFFNLTKAQEMAWKNGDLAIYQYNSASHIWNKLSTFAVREVAGSYRIAAVAPAFGVFGLGELK
jgi:hypothetical protein